MPKQIYLIRHGQSSHNADANQLSGITDVSMTGAGREHCRALSHYFKKRPVDMTYSSRLARAQETAALVFPDGPKVQVRDELLELDYGQYEGVPVDDLPADDPIALQWRDSPGNMTFPGGQNMREFADLVFAGLHQLVGGSAADRIACIGHKTMGRLFVARVIGLDLNHFRIIPMDNCSVTRFTWTEDGGFVLRGLNLAADDLRL